MLDSFKNLMNFEVHETNGHLGKIVDFYFDERNEKIIFFIIKVTHWLQSKEVLVAPSKISDIDWQNKIVHISLSKEQLELAPDASEVPTSTEQYEEFFRSKNIFPVYWNYDWAYATYASEQWFKGEDLSEEEKNKVERNHIQSAKSLLSYDIILNNSHFARVSDFTISTEDWSISNFIIDCGNWFTHRYKQVVKDEVSEINWREKAVVLDMSKDDVERLPTLSPEDVEWHTLPAESIFP